MDKCPMCNYVDPSTVQNKPQTTHMNNYVVDSLSNEKDKLVGAKIVNSNERYLVLANVLHRRADLPHGAPKELAVKASNDKGVFNPAKVPDKFIEKEIVNTSANDGKSVPQTKDNPLGIATGGTIKEQIVADTKVEIVPTKPAIVNPEVQPATQPAVKPTT